MGEHEFASWCASVGLIPNWPERDAGGWDYFVQFGAPEVPPGVCTLDHIEPPRSCWIQVKSTDSKTASNIALSNWLRMIDPALPFFVLLLDFAGQEHAVEANLVHVDQRFIEKALKRLRELPIGRILVVVGMAHIGPIQECQLRDARWEFCVRNPRRELVYVEKIPMVDGQTYPAYPWVQKVAARIAAQNIDLLPAPVLPDDE